MVAAGGCLPRTFGSTMLKRNCVEVPMKSIGIHMTDVLAKQAQTKTTAGGARVAPLLKTATQKAIAYGVQVKTKPNTVMTIPDKEKRCSSLESMYSHAKSFTFQDTSFHLDTFVAQFGFDAMCRLVLHLFQSEVDECVRNNQDDQRNAIDNDEDEEIVGDEQRTRIVEIRTARCSCALEVTERERNTRLSEVRKSQRARRTTDLPVCIRSSRKAASE